MTYYGRWDYKFAEAARQGAIGALLIHDTLPAAYGWPTVVNSWTGPQLAMVLPDQGAGRGADVRAVPVASCADCRVLARPGSR